MGGGPELQPTGSFEWVRVIDCVDFDTAPAVQKLSKKHRPAARTIAGISYRLAFWADWKTGSDLRPSNTRIAVTCRVDPKTAGTVMSILRDLGLLDLVVRGNHRRASEYRLTVPTDLLDRVKVISPTEFEARMEALRSTRRADSNGGMPTCAEPPATGGCPPQGEEDVASSNGGMPASEPTATGGCPPSSGGMHTPHLPKTHHQTPPPKTSPQASTSPAAPSADAQPDPSRDPPGDQEAERRDQASRLRGWESAHPEYA